LTALVLLAGLATGDLTARAAPAGRAGGYATAGAYAAKPIEERAETSEEAEIAEKAALVGATAKPIATSGPTAINDFASCVAGQRSGDVLLLIDQSGSLQQTDPAAARVTAARYLLKTLETSAETDGDNVSVAVAGFAGQYVPTLGWTALSASSLPVVDRTVGGFAPKNTGFETDYWSALNGSREALAERVTALGGSPRCQAIVWFTDGEMDIPPRVTPAEVSEYGTTKPYSGALSLTSGAAAAQAQSMGEKDICRAGGLADQLRASGVEVFAIGLQGPGPAQDFGLLSSIATGSAMNGAAGGRAVRGGACGTITSPSPGSFQRATDIDSLLFDFDSEAVPGHPAIVTKEGICQRSLCARDSHDFVLDSSIDAVHILATSSVAHATVFLQGPGGWRSLLGDHGTVSVDQFAHGNMGFSYTWLSPETLTVDMSAPAHASGWAGLWSLTFVDPSGTSPRGRSESAVHLFGDVFPTWPGHATAVLRTGTLDGAQLGLASSKGAVIDPMSLLGRVRLSAALVGPGGGTSPVATDLTKAAMGRPVRLDLRRVKPGSYALRLSLAITTAAARGPQGQVEPGTALAPQTVDVPFTVEPPLDYPVVGTHVDFGTVDGAADVMAGLRVIGPGCVWYAGRPAVTTMPSDIGRTALVAVGAGSRGRCLEVPAGRAGTLALRLTTQRSGNGTINGSFPVAMVPGGGGGPVLSVDVPFTADLQGTENAFHFWLALIVVALLGPGVPLLIVYGAKWWLAKIPGAPLYAQQIEVSVVDGRVLRDGAELRLTGSDLVRHMVPLPLRGARSIEAGGARLSARTGWRPGGAGYVVASMPGKVAASSTRPSHDHRLRALLPLAVHNHWALFHDPAGPPDVATLLVLVRAEGPYRERSDLVADVSCRAGEILASLRRAAVGGGVPGASREGGPDGPGGAGDEVPDPFGPPAAQPEQRGPFDLGTAGTGTAGTGPTGTGAAGTGPAGTGRQNSG
jgi:hypothetical protein